MARILILDDDTDYCEELALCLSNEEHEILTAESGSEAIRIGSLFRPDVLVTDWLLREACDGLNVSEILEIINPKMKTILITGFASNDLKADAKYQEVFAFIEKPFNIKRIRDVVDAAISTQRSSEHLIPIGITELGPDGSILYANPQAKQMFPALKENLSVLDDIIDEPSEHILTASEDKWIKVSSPADKKLSWYLRSRTYSESASTLLVFLSLEHSSYMYEPLTYQLLGTAPPRSLELALDGHLLVIDDFEQNRRVAAAILREFQCICLTAQSLGEANRLFENDPMIKHVIIDYGTSEAQARSFVEKIKRIRPETRIIGTSASGYSKDFATLGVAEFLPKPWKDEELITLVAAGTRVSPQAVH